MALLLAARHYMSVASFVMLVTQSCLTYCWARLFQIRLASAGYSCIGTLFFARV